MEFLPDSYLSYRVDGEIMQLGGRNVTDSLHLEAGSNFEDREQCIDGMECLHWFTWSFSPSVQNQRGGLKIRLTKEIGWNKVERSQFRISRGILEAACCYSLRWATLFLSPEVE